MACGSKAALRTLRPLRGIVNADHNRKYHFVAVESHDDGFVERVIDFPLAENVGIAGKFVPDPVISRTSGGYFVIGYISDRDGEEEVQCVSMEKSKKKE